MYPLIDKLALAFTTSILFLTLFFSMYSISYILVAMIFACISSYYNNEKIRFFVQCIYFILCLYSPLFLFFIPIIVYDTYHTRNVCFMIVYIILIIINAKELTVIYIFAIASLTLLSYLMYFKSFNLHQTLLLNKKIKDDSEELKIYQAKKHKEFLDKQDYEIQLAKAEERNRIAREIHDSVGHNLSSSLLQIGAMIALNQDEKLRQPLIAMKDTLSDGMNSIRNSVHDLHEDTLNLEEEMHKIIQQFNFCEVNFNCHITNLMEMKLKYCFLNILKEALSNIIKHSNATLVNISFIESETFYQFIIHDNGTKIQIKDGLGLKSMKERIEIYHGIYRYTIDKGFKIFINIPKEKRL